MKAYSLIVIFIFTCCICKHTSVEIIPELMKNILNFGLGINCKYEGMLAHSFDRFYVVTKFILPSVNDLKILTIDFNEKCNYLNDNNDNIFNLKVYCKKIVPLVHILRNKFLPIIAQYITF